MDCKWLPANHALFQCANICLALSYLAPDNLNGLLFLRFSLGAAGVFFMTWGWIILCSLDTLLWNAGFAILNFAHFIYILVRMFRPVILNHNHEEIFTKLFQPLGVKRFQYKPLEEDGCIMKLKSGEIYAQEDKTKLERISVIMRGRYLIRVVNDLGITGPCSH